MDEVMKKIFPFLLLLSCILNIKSVHSVVINEGATNFNKENLEEALNFLSPNSFFENYRDTLNVYNNEPNTQNDSCSYEIRILAQALVERKLWALKMIDASSKINSGILEGNIVDLGMFDECVEISEEVNDVEIHGRHCMYTFAVSYNKKFIFSPKLSICIPSSCTADDLSSLINSTIKNITSLGDFQILLNTVTCTMDDEETWDTEFIIWFTIFIVYVGILIICTISDIYLEYVGAQKIKNSSFQLLSSFSMRKSIRAIFKNNVKPGNLPVIHGIRFLSTAWVILGHRYITLIKLIMNPMHFSTWVRAWNSLYIFLAPFAVDTFFAMSGLLLAYVFFNQMPKQKKFNVPLFYFHRFLRLTPSLAALLVFVIVFKPQIGSGPMWNTIESKECHDKWWEILLYIQNFTNLYTCLGHLWYLSVDMQLFWFSPIILYLLYKKPKIGLFFLGFLTILSLVIHASIVGIHEYHGLSATLDNNTTRINDAFKYVYVKPYTRASPWLIGIFSGYILVNNNRKLSKMFFYFGWFLAIGSFVFCGLGTKYMMDKNYEYNNAFETMFETISKPLWGFAVCWIILASYYNYGGPISTLLSYKVFEPLSRLSYCTYLVHFMLMDVDLHLKRAPEYFSDYIIWRTFFSDLVMCIIVGFFLSLLFESPMINLEKLLFKKPSKPQEESQNEHRTEQEDIMKDKKF